MTAGPVGHRMMGVRHDRGVRWVPLALLLRGVFLAVPAAAGGAQVGGTVASLQATLPPPAPPSPARRPFEHSRHEGLACRGCHGAGAMHRVTRVQAPEGCDGCHHDPERGPACASCHAPAATAMPRTVRLSLPLRVTASPRTREVTFEHATHTEERGQLACRECHGTPGSLRRGRACGSCHASHHEQPTECASCHGAPPTGVHGLDVHLGCGTSGCHAAERAPSPAQGRAACLYCHAAQREHEPGGTCAGCHRIPGASPQSGDGGRSGRVP